jgi:hypothetical protein
MSTYDSYDGDEPRRHRSHRHHHHHRDRDGDGRYVETKDTYVRSPTIVDDPYLSSRQDLALRRDDSEVSVEEVRREFPPPAGRMVVRDERYGAVRARSADRRGYHDDPRRSGDFEDESYRSSRKSLKVDEVQTRHRSLSNSQKILAAGVGAALAVGSKELWDRRQAKVHGEPSPDRNLLASAAIGAAGAFAGYEGAELYTKKIAKKEKPKEKHYETYRDKNGNLIEHYSSDEDIEKPKRRKSILEKAAGLAGLGAAARALTGGDKDRDHGDDRRSRRGSDSDGGRSKRGRSPEGIAKYQQAAKAALIAGATEAFRVRNEPGGWGGAKGKRILTAAIAGGGIGGATANEDNPDHHKKRHLLESVIGGLAANRVVNGSRSNVAEEDARSQHGGRSRSRSRAPLAAGLATAGLGALAAKKIHDHSRSRSRAGDDRRYSSDEDNRRGSSRKRSKSITDVARKGLAALGLGGGDDHRDREVDEETRIRRSHSRRRKDDSDSDYDHRDRDRDKDRDYEDRDRDRSSRRSRRSDGKRNRAIAEGKISDSDSLGSSTDDEKKMKKMKGKQFLTAGLATVATIHAAHNVYQSVVKRKARKKAVEEGEMSPEEERKLKAKARLQDVASIGIAALGIKGAYSGMYLLRIRI